MRRRLAACWPVTISRSMGRGREGKRSGQVGLGRPTDRGLPACLVARQLPSFPQSRTHQSCMGLGKWGPLVPLLPQTCVLGTHSSNFSTHSILLPSSITNDIMTMLPSVFVFVFVTLVSGHPTIRPTRLRRNQQVLQTEPTIVPNAATQTAGETIHCLRTVTPHVHCE